MLFAYRTDKPKKPAVKVPDTTKEGDSLDIQCTSESNSLPEEYRRPLVIRWFKHGHILDPSNLPTKVSKSCGNDCQKGGNFMVL